MAVSRRAFLQGVMGAVGVAVLGGCGDGEVIGANSSKDGDFLLPVSVPDGAHVVVSNSSILSGFQPRWFRSMSNKHWVTAAYAIAGEFQAPDEPIHQAPGEPPLTTERHGRLTYGLYSPPEPGGMYTLFIDDHRSSVIFTGFSSTDLAASELIAQFTDIVLPFDPETGTLPGFVGPLPPPSGGTFSVTAPSGKVLLGVAFAKLPETGPRLDQIQPKSTHRWIDGRRITIGDAGGAFGAGVLVYEEPDGLRVMGGGSVAPDIESLVRAVRRVDRQAWDAALLQYAPVLPTTTEPPDVARWPRDATRPVSPGIVFADDFLADVPSVDGGDGVRAHIVTVEGTPTGAAAAGLARAMAAIEAMRSDGGYTDDGMSPYFAFEFVDKRPEGWFMDIRALSPAGHESMRRTIVEEISYAGVADARVSSRPAYS